MHGNLADLGRGSVVRDCLVLILAEEFNQTVLFVDEITEQICIHIDEH